MNKKIVRRILAMLAVCMMLVCGTHMIPATGAKAEQDSFVEPIEEAIVEETVAAPAEDAEEAADLTDAEPAEDAPEAEELAEDAPEAEESAEETPVAEEPAAEETAVEETVVEETVAEEPAAEEPVVEEPVVVEIAVAEPVVEEQIAEETAVEETVVEEPAAEEPAPAAEEIVVAEPVEETPVVEEPAAEEPVAEEPVVEEPVAEETEATETEQTEVWTAETEEPAAEEIEIEEYETALGIPGGEYSQPAAGAVEIVTEEDEIPENAVLIGEILDELNANRRIQIYIAGENEEIHFGDEVTLYAVLIGYEDCEYTIQWQVSPDDEEYTDVIGETEKTYSFVVTEENYTNYWRVAVTITAVNIPD